MKKVLTLWIPIIALILATIDGFHRMPWMYGELGVIENLTVVFLLLGLGLLLANAKHFKTMNGLDRMAYVVLILGSIYFAGEELSWGQHWGEKVIGFETEQGRWEGNYQNEMNLHNREGMLKFLLDRLPRTLITIGIALCGIIFPYCKNRLPAWIAKYVPGKEVLVVSLLAVFISVPNKLVKLAIKAKSEFDSGEMKEFYIALFILLFVMHFVRVAKKEVAA
jgi:hypothetical protein